METVNITVRTDFAIEEDLATLTARVVDLEESNVSIFTDGTTNYRINVRSGVMCFDKALTVTGFAGVESIDGGVTGDWIKLTQFE